MHLPDLQAHVPTVNKQSLLFFLLKEKYLNFTLLDFLRIS